MRFFTPRVPLKEKLFFAEHLAVMLRASIPLDRALTTLVDQTSNKALKKILASVEEHVRQGDTLSSGLAAFESTFGGFFISMLQAGEYSGKLDGALRRLYEQMKKDYDLRSKVKSALTYPAFIVMAMIGIGTVIMLYVIPKLIPLFEGFHTQLPLSTRILIGVSGFLSHYFFFLLPLVLLLILILVKLLRGPWKAGWHGLLLHLPSIGPLVQKINLARFARTLGTLLSTDILVVHALTITSQVLSNEQYRRALTALADMVKQGIPISQALKTNTRLFPPTIQTMVTVGEESGTLTDLLDEIANFYEESVDETTKGISSIIEPALIVLLGAAVGGIALAILMPMYALLQQV